MRRALAAALLAVALLLFVAGVGIALSWTGDAPWWAHVFVGASVAALGALVLLIAWRLLRPSS